MDKLTLDDRTTVLVAISEFDTRQALTDLIEREGHTLDTMTDRAREELGARLAKAVGRVKPWGRDMIRAVCAGKLQPGRDFVLAVMALRAVTNAVPMVWATAQAVTVYSSGQVEPGSLLTTASRKCVICIRPFIPHSWNDKCCSSECDSKRKQNGKAIERGEGTNGSQTN